MKEVFLQKHSQKVLSWTSSPKIEDPGGFCLCWGWSRVGKGMEHGRVVGRDDRWRAESWVLLLRPELAAFLTSLPSHHLLPLSHHCLWSGLPSGRTIHPFLTLAGAVQRGGWL